MLFVNVLAAALALATSIVAFKLPEGLPDGSYIAFIDENGQEAHQPFSVELQKHLSTFPSAKGPSKPSPEAHNTTLEARQDNFWETWCGCGISLPHGNTDRAVQGIKDQCKNAANSAGAGACAMNSDNAWYTIYGDVVAFMCYGGEATVKEISLAFEKVTHACGWYIAGSSQHEKGFWEELVYGYMYYSPGLDFCKNSVGITVELLSAVDEAEGEWRTVSCIWDSRMVLSRKQGREIAMGFGLL
ncbi:hypothetical protein B0T22DRAFT_373944 [Podospora appendiculata]|uniref:Ecp2 effector protein domain-containing protein n=1 Tax=Podospora appendiculata TaxID=314037 RepID=A0AAE0XHD4_9PEZI|nr:hypothetical protein B0T22DRAFT_373944 [Podospora appendiculata]